MALSIEAFNHTDSRLFILKILSLIYTRIFLKQEKNRFTSSKQKK